MKQFDIIRNNTVNIHRESEYGEYISYKDHLEEMEPLKQENERLREALINYHDNECSCDGSCKIAKIISG